MIPPEAAPTHPAEAPPEVITAILATMRGIVGRHPRISIREIRDTLVAAHPGYDAVIDVMIREAWSRMSREQQATECAPQQPHLQNGHDEPPGAGGETA